MCSRDDIAESYFDLITGYILFAASVQCRVSDVLWQTMGRLRTIIIEINVFITCGFSLTPSLLFFMFHVLWMNTRGLLCIAFSLYGL